MRVIGHVGLIDYCFPARGLDFGNDRIGILQIVDDDFGAALGERKRMSATETAAGACNYGHLAIKSDAHNLPLWI